MFTHLHTHSHYSLLNALPKIPELVRAAKERDMQALALTDNGNLYGAIQFYKHCNNHDIKPIIGVDFYVALRTRHDKEAGVDNRRHRLVLLAENERGYKNLIKLVTRSYTEGFYYKPRIDEELMRAYARGLIAIIPSFSGETTVLLRGDDTTAAQEKLHTYKDLYGNNNVFLEITHHPEINGHEQLQTKIKTLARDTNTALVAAHDVYYITQEDKQARDTLLSIQSNPDRFGTQSFDDDEEDFSFITSEQAQGFFADTPEALKNTKKIADRCSVEIELGKWTFPNFEIPKGSTYEDELRTLVEEGLKQREMKETPEVRERIAFELDTINAKGYAPYFLVVGDLMRYAHEHNILSTIRGSVAGSLVTYLAGITTIDPLEYQLPFERFLNPERPSPPDIDMDFAYDRRDEVIAYAREKYGEDNVAQIGTFGTMMARGSVRDTARALGFDYTTADRIAKLIPFGKQGFPMSIERAMREEPELKKLYDTDTDTKRIIDMAQKIEGCARHISVHAAGVVMSSIPLDEVVPTQPDPKGSGKTITQYNMHDVEDVGLLKFDFLGLTNLSTIADSVKRVKKLYDKDIAIEHIPLNDKKTFAMLARGETMGVFQLAGGAMTQFLKDLKPTTIHDINAMVALYRPGPMRNIPEYIARKHGKSPVTYYHPKMKDFLERSYGILVYQDDLLSTALEIAGYTWKTVDKFRKAVGKKIPEEMARQHVIFVEGCMKHSDMSKEQAEGLWNLFEPFQGYGFNKAHAASYGRVAYQTAYMKANYPAVYMAALLTSESGDVEKIAEIITECKRMNIPVLPPDINESATDFTVVKNQDQAESIRFGLTTIKNFGEGIAESIIAEREKNGKFKSIADFLDRITDRNLNRKSLESLIKAGAFDTLERRGKLLANIDDLLAYNKALSSKPEGQDSLFALMDDTSSVPQLTLKDAPSMKPSEKLTWEKELLGLYISGHPLDHYEKELKKYGSVLQAHDARKESTVTLGGMIEELRAVTTRKNERMAFVRVADRTGSIEVVLFPRIYTEFRHLLEQDRPLAFKGRLSDRNGERSMVVEKVKLL